MPHQRDDDARNFWYGRWGFIVAAALAVTVVVFGGVVVVYSRRSEKIDQPALRCWPTITAAPEQVRAGDSVRVSSNGFQCGNLPNRDTPSHFWLEVTPEAGNVLVLRSASFAREPNAAFALTLQLPSNIKAGRLRINVAGHPEYVPSRDCTITPGLPKCQGPTLRPIITVVGG